MVDTAQRISIPSINSAFEPFVPSNVKDFATFSTGIIKLPSLSQVISDISNISNVSTPVVDFSGLDLLCTVATSPAGNSVDALHVNYGLYGAHGVYGAYGVYGVNGVNGVHGIPPLVPLSVIVAGTAKIVKIHQVPEPVQASKATKATKAPKAPKPAKPAKPTNSAKPTKIEPNKLCTTPGHSVRKTSIQKHTCKKCFVERAKELCEDPHLTRWNVARLLVREFRNYYCSFCVLESYASKNFTRVGLGKRCIRGHLAISKERVCKDHGKEFKACNECIDPRAATIFNLCGHRFFTKCGCSSKKQFSGEQTQDVIDLQEGYAVQTLQRAAAMQL